MAEDDPIVTPDDPLLQRSLDVGVLLTTQRKRIEALERTLRQAIGCLSWTKRFIGAATMQHMGGTSIPRNVHETIDTRAEELSATLPKDQRP